MAFTLADWKAGSIMAGRKWNNNSIAKQIVETARSRAEAAARAPLSDDLDLLGRLQALDAVDLQSLAARLGSYAWKRRLYPDDLLTLSSTLLRAQTPAGDTLTVPQNAFASVMDDVLRALSYGEDSIMPWCEPWQVEQRAREVWRTPVEDRSVVDASFVRSLLEPLMAGDRAAFRSLLGALGKELVDLGVRGVDGRLPNVTSLIGYQQLGTLQGALNGILHASRATSRVPGEVEAAV
jgi:hypothetical protein